MSTIYPLGHSTGELDRLDIQAMLFRDPLLERLAEQSSSCLEIGCGNGSNLSLLRSANPHLSYTGIDTASGAIASAKGRFGEDAKARFIVMDGSSASIQAEQFDLVFTKLVLWSIGPDWGDVLDEAYRLLQPGGTFYAFEPCNHLVEIYPKRPALTAWMNAWDACAVQHGLDPFVGTKVAGALNARGFIAVESKFFPVIAPASEEERYRAIVDNLKGFYMGPSVDSFGLNHDDGLRGAALDELNDMSPDNLVMDALFVSCGRKPQTSI